MNLVFIDFDNTVTRLDTTLPFGAFFSGQRGSRDGLHALILALVLAKFRLLSNTGLKRVFARSHLRGQTVAGIRQLARQFYAAHLEIMADDEVLGLLRKHVDGGDSVYLVSANFDCLLEPLIAHWSLAGVIATRAEIREGNYTGRLVGTACHGQEKLRRIVAQFGLAAVERATAYGNRDDAPLLDAVRTGYLIRRVQPNRRFGRLREWRRILSGKVIRDELSAARRIEPYRAPRVPAAVAPVDA